MALTFRVLYRNRNYLHILTKPTKWTLGRQSSVQFVSSGICYQNVYNHSLLIEPKPTLPQLRYYVTQGTSDDRDSTSSQKEDKKKPGLIQRFKQMYKDYWYVLLPVHMATSAIWFGSFYYVVRSGVDVISLLQTIGVSETLITPLRNSGAGYLALTFALYKLVTPLRYAVTVGGTTYAIRRLTAIGWIKPVPSRERIKEMFQEKKDNLQDRFNESKQHYQSQIKEKRSQMMDEMRRYKSDMRNMKNKTQQKP